jgi:CRISPR-associated endonuclease Csn1
VRDGDNKWLGEVISTFEAYQSVRKHGAERLRHLRLSASGRPLVMRLMIDDFVRLEIEGRTRTMRVAKMSGNGQVFMAAHHEANADARNRDREDAFGYVSKKASSFLSARARRVTISPIGEVRDPGFRG